MDQTQEGAGRMNAMIPVKSPAELSMEEILLQTRDSAQELLAMAQHDIEYLPWEMGAKMTVFRLQRELGLPDRIAEWKPGQFGQLKTALHECAQHGLVPGRHASLLAFYDNDNKIHKITVHWTDEGVKELAYEHGCEIDVPEIVYQKDHYKREVVVKDGKRVMNFEHKIEQAKDRGPAVGCYVTFRIRNKQGEMEPTQFLYEDSGYFARVTRSIRRKYSAWSGDFGTEMWKVNRRRAVRKYLPMGLPSLSGDRAEFDAEQAPDTGPTVGTVAEMGETATRRHRPGPLPVSAGEDARTALDSDEKPQQGRVLDEKTQGALDQAGEQALREQQQTQQPEQPTKPKRRTRTKPKASRAQPAPAAGGAPPPAAADAVTKREPAPDTSPAPGGDEPPPPIDDSSLFGGGGMFEVRE